MKAFGARWLTLAAASLAALSAANEVANGDFEKEADGGGRPAQWQAAGSAEIVQQLGRDAGREGKGFSARLTCTAFAGGSAASHAMLCQVGVVGLRRGAWYRLAFWARGEGIRGGTLDVAISNTRNWSSTGLSDAVELEGAWRPYEIFFQATQGLAAADSRLQFWFRSTGTLWLDDVDLAPAEMKVQRHPQLPTAGRANLIPNSSFECGTAGWGSYAPDLNTWTGNVYRLFGDLDDSTAAHGRHSLRMRLPVNDPPTFYFDWFDPVRQRVSQVVAAHQGWAVLPKGQPCTLSASLKADAAGVVGVLLVRQADARMQRQTFPLSAAWQRYVFTFTPESEYVWAGVGFSRTAARPEDATVWVDAVQLERGPQATPYQPALPVEVLAGTPRPGNLFTATGDQPGMTLDLHAFNAGATPGRATVQVAVTDYRDREILRQDLAMSVPDQGAATQSVRLPTGSAGFFRVQVMQDGTAVQPPLRCAVIRPVDGNAARFGMNHAYPWDFLLPLAQQAGVTWWRDWSVQWRTLQPTPESGFDFREPDLQIDRVLKQGGNVLVLFPFPSSDWASTADAAAMAKVVRNDYESRRVPLAFKPRDEAAFERYISASVAHYRDRITAYQVFNESLYTNYSLPATGGHTVADYVRLLRLAYNAIKAAQPGALVVGGLGVWADSSWTRDFVEAGGMQCLDVLDLHLYPRGRPEPYAESLAGLRARLKERGESKPIWITELGCYADDDPPKTPMAAAFGDAAMRRALHASEREATAWLVTFTALVAAQGVERIFLHAGTCGEINGIDAGGVLFEYGGTPRQMLPGIAALSRLLPATAACERTEPLAEGVTATWFRTPAGPVAVAWASDGRSHSLRLPAGVGAADLMGNPLATDAVECSREPVYLIGR